MSYVARTTEISVRQPNGETNVMGASGAAVYTLNGVAAAIWESADGRTTLEAIIRERICSQFDVTPEVALRDAERFVADLVVSGVLRISERPIEPAPRHFQKSA